MTDKQIIIDDQKKTIHRLQQECTEKTNIIIALGNKLQAKEQECEELKKIINEAKNSKLDLNSFFAIEATVGEYQLELDQLKSENKHLNDLLNQALKDYDKARETLTEIKEIAEKLKNFYEELGKCEDLTVVRLKQILQKISEVEE